MQSKWHNISIKTESFEELRRIQRSIPIRTSIPQTIEWLIKVGQKQINQINQSETNDKTEL
jgi:phosphoenolpyruvate synthase/pyruvate phosphate dikinase|tara:strand:- start:4182 stop:4364 length:183 start_codon:yes stop_codon:yes gene_type:complete